MQILLLSIMAKCGVFTHVRDLAVHLHKLGMNPVIGFINDPYARYLFQVSKWDQSVMEDSLNGIPCFYFTSENEMLDKTKSIKFDLVHAHSPLVLKHGVGIKMQMGIPFIITLHGIANWSQLHSHELKHADGLIAIGPEVADSAGSEFREKVNIIFNGIDTDHFKPYDNRIDDTNTLRIAWTGRVTGTAAKGVRCLSASINMLRKKGVPIEAKIIGNLHGAYIREIETYGWLHDPLPILQWSNIAFGRGRSLREAMACGNVGFLLAEGYGGPVDSKWFENGMQPQLSGSLKHGYSELNPVEIANDILYFYKHMDQLESARREARKIAEEYFDIRKMVRDTYKVYEDTISKSL